MARVKVAWVEGGIGMGLLRPVYNLAGIWLESGLTNPPPEVGLPFLKLNQLINPVVSVCKHCVYDTLYRFLHNQHCRKYFNCFVGILYLCYIYIL